MIKTILVPTDGSHHANNAVELAAEIASKFGARLVILQVLLHHHSTSELRELCESLGAPANLVAKLDRLDDAMIEASAADYGPVPLPVPAEILKPIGDLIVKKSRKMAEAKGVSLLKTEVVDGKPADCIMAAVDYEKADMIVMGRRGLGNVTGLLMGSVSHKVSHLADCACVTVK
tara:strand:+ start:1140 stop:1664 length:525 start_codon:yes stop_codon:yes gene_type:complete